MQRRGYVVQFWAMALLKSTRAKSKSGPINVPPGIGHYQNCSPSIAVLDGGIVRNFMVNTPFSTGVLMPTGVGSRYSGIGSGNCGQDHVERWLVLLVGLTWQASLHLPALKMKKKRELVDSCWNA